MNESKFWKEKLWVIYGDKEGSAKTDWYVCKYESTFDQVCLAPRDMEEVWNSVSLRLWAKLDNSSIGYLKIQKDYSLYIKLYLIYLQLLH